MERNDQFFGAMLVGLMAFVGLLAIASSHDHGSAAEWAAAVGTIAAVFAALRTAGQALKYERDRNDARARVCAYYLAPIVISINNRSERAFAYGSANNYGLNDMADPGFLTKVGQQLDINVELSLDAFTNLWALPSLVARDCIRLHAFLNQYRELAGSNIPRLRQMDASARDTYVNAMTLSLNNIRAISARARDALMQLNEEH